MDKQYDSIVSLGGFCAPAIQMRARGLRACAMPFDWLLMTSDASVKWFANAVSTDFNGLCLKENLQLLPKCGTGSAPFRYLDIASGMIFKHHFHKPIEAGGYAEVFETLQRRLRRFKALFVPNKSVLLILATTFPYEWNIADRILQAFRTRYPQTKVDLHVIQFAGCLEHPSSISERPPDGSSFTGLRCARRHGDYDLNYTSSEWAFLDEISIKGRSLPRLHGWSKFKFKLWKAFSKSLRDNGYGCLGIRFSAKSK